jgi:hypothetical protein
MAQVKPHIAAQVDENATRANAERAALDQANADYFSCLERNAKELALNSHETADIVAQASLAACPVERQNALDVNRRYHETFDDGAMEAADKLIVQHLLLEIVQIRAHPE